jgi:SAM-dependent methyltransferase
MAIKNRLAKENLYYKINIKIMWKILQRLLISKIASVTKYSLEKELLKQFKRLKPGIVLDVGSKNAPYKRYIPHTEYMTLDINPQVKPDIVADIHNVNWESNYFDTIIATEVLEHCYCPQKVIDEIYRLLKQEGICILSTRFIYPYHPDPKDYYRFTKDALEDLFKN